MCPIHHIASSIKPLARWIAGITTRYWGFGLQFYTFGNRLLLLPDEVIEEQMNSIIEACKKHGIVVIGEVSESLTIFEFMHRLSAGGLSVVKARV